MRVALALLLAAASPAAGQVAGFVVRGDAIDAPLAGLVRDAMRGAAVVKHRESAHCLICQSIPDAREAFMGEIGPPLAGVGARLRRLRACSLGVRVEQLPLGSPDYLALELFLAARARGRCRSKRAGCGAGLLHGGDRESRLALDLQRGAAFGQLPLHRVAVGP